MSVAPVAPLEAYFVDAVEERATEHLLSEIGVRVGAAGAELQVRRREHPLP